MVKTGKADNPVHVATSVFNTVVEKLSILFEKTLYPLVDRLNWKIKDTNNLLNPPIALAILHLRPATLKTTYGRYLEV